LVNSIGLQAVDGLKTSEYLQETARRNIEGESNTLKNRYMMIDGPEEWKLPESEQTPREDRTSTGQAAH
jgi:hypothetical protein